MNSQCIIQGLNKAIAEQFPAFSLSNIFGFSLGVGAVIAFGIIVYAGLLWTSSMGNPSKIKDAKDRIFAALLGLVILATGFILLNTINPALVGGGSPDKTADCPQ